MSKNTYIQLLLIFIFIFISLFLFLKYFKKSSFESNTKTNLELTTTTSESLIEDLKYLSTDKKGNKYEIEAEKGNIDKNNPDIIYLENVEAVILLQNSSIQSVEFCKI